MSTVIKCNRGRTIDFCAPNCTLHESKGWDESLLIFCSLVALMEVIIFQGCNFFFSCSAVLLLIFYSSIVLLFVLSIVDSIRFVQVLLLVRRAVKREILTPIILCPLHIKSTQIKVFLCKLGLVNSLQALSG